MCTGGCGCCRSLVTAWAGRQTWEKGIQERGISGKCNQVTSNKMGRTPCEAQDTEILS